MLTVLLPTAGSAEVQKTCIETCFTPSVEVCLGDKYYTCRHMQMYPTFCFDLSESLESSNLIEISSNISINKIIILGKMSN